MARPYKPMIGAFSHAPAPSRRVIVDPGLLPYRDRAALRILYRADVATTSQLTTLVYTRRQTAQERLTALYRAGYLERAILPPSTGGGAPYAFRVSPRGRRRLHYDPLTRARAGTQLRHSLNGVETVAALVQARAGSSEPLVQAWLTESMANDLLPKTYPDSVVVLQAASGSAVLCLEIDESTERGPVILDKLARYETALRDRAGWHVLFIAGYAERVASLARTGRYKGGYAGLAGKAWALVLPELQAHGLDAGIVALNSDVARTTLGSLLVDPTTRRCPTPVGTDAWLRVLGYFGLEDLDEALR
jgi:hypothetical protein